MKNFIIQNWFYVCVTFISLVSVSVVSLVYLGTKALNVLNDIAMSSADIAYYTCFLDDDNSDAEDLSAVDSEKKDN